jgi:hypothetical protein
MSLRLLSLLAAVVTFVALSVSSHCQGGSSLALSAAGPPPGPSARLVAPAEELADASADSAGVAAQSGRDFDPQGQLQ